MNSWRAEENYENLRNSLYSNRLPLLTSQKYFPCY